LLQAAELLRATRPRLEVVVSAADRFAEDVIAEQRRVASPNPIEIVRGARAALDDADAAWIASGTAVLEAALLEVPAVALYVVAKAQVAIAQRIWHRPFITLPNILLNRAAVPELLQDAATPEALASALDAILRDPSEQVRAVRELRALLGPADALERAAALAVETARS
jgi:lipid-A-disaccharide synthase